MLKHDKVLNTLHLSPGKGPIYKQIKEWAQHAILRGRLMPGEIFPSEVKIADIAGVTRMTVRHATRELVAEGLLVREKGKHPRVAERKILAKFLDLAGITQYVTEYEGEYSCQVLDARLVNPEPEVAEALSVRSGGKVYFLDRLRSMNGLIFGHERTWICRKLCPGIEKYDFSNYSLYDILKNDYQITPEYSKGAIDVFIAGSGQAKLLKLKVGTPLLSIHRTVFTNTGQPLQVNHEIYRGDCYSFAFMAGNISHG